MGGAEASHVHGRPRRDVANERRASRLKGEYLKILSTISSRFMRCMNHQLGSTMEDRVQQLRLAQEVLVTPAVDRKGRSSQAVGII